MKKVEANLCAKGLKVAVIAARFNEFITARLIEGAEDGLLRHGADAEDITLYRVPGAFEIPVLAQKIAAKDEFDAVICLGAVIRGNTPHFDYVAAEVSKGVASVSLKSGKPVVFGVLTTDNIEQAIERAGSKGGNKGYEAAVTAIEMANLMREI